MSGSDETRELGGLARSIDALFTSHESPAQAEPEDSVGGPEPTAGPDAEGPGRQEIEPPADGAGTLEGFGAPGSEPMAEASSAPEPADEPLAPEPDVDNQPAADPEAPGARDEGVVETTGGPAAQELATAVEEFLDGSAEAGDRIPRLAAPLLDQYALDPLADAAEKLVHAAGDPPDESVMAVAHSVMNPAVASKLVHRMGAEPEPRRAEYIVMAQRLGRIMAIAIRGALTDATDRSARRAYYDALVAMGRTSRPIIEGMVDDENRFLVRNAVAILGEIGGDGAAELVTSALANTDARVRKEALRSLAKLGAKDADQLVVAHLEDSDPTVRIAAALTAGELKVERALRHIIAMLEAEEEPEGRIPLLRALGQLGDPGAVPAIEKHGVGTRFSRPPTEVRVEAYRALFHIGTPHARKLLEQAQKDKDAEVKSLANELIRSG